MDDKYLFQATLGLKAPWFVSDVKLNKVDKKLDIFIDFERGARFPCPECGSLCELHDTDQRTWRHLNFFESRFRHLIVSKMRKSDHCVNAGRCSAQY